MPDLPFVQQVVPILLAQVGKFWTQQRKLDGVKVVAFTTAIATHYYIVLRAELLDLLLRSEAPEPGDDYMLDMHGRS